MRKRISAIGHRRTTIGWTCVVLAVAFGFVAVAEACNVPVFRFALERWRPDSYRVTVFHRGPLNDVDQALIAALEAKQEKASLNVAVRTLDLSELGDADRELFASLGDTKLPALVVHYPTHLRIPTPVWSGPLTSEAIAHVTDSPLRQEIVKRLVDGQTAVWLLLESGQADKDDAAAKLVQEQIQKLEKALKLPELTEAPDDKLLAATPLQLAFSLLRVPRGEAEQPLIQMLVNSESDLPDRSDPLVFPVFGRGRAMFGLVGAGITAQNVEYSAAFLVGACSCEVKEQNPGFDLLLAADWDVLLAQEGVPLTAAATRGTIPTGDAELIPIPQGSSSSGEHSSSSNPTSAPRGNNWLVMGLLFAGAIVIVGLTVRRS